MGFLFHPLYLLMYIVTAIFFLFPCFSAVNIKVQSFKCENPEKDLGFFPVEEGKEAIRSLIQKVSGEENGGRKLWPVLHQVGVLVGFKSHHKDMPSNDYIGSSPAPAPAPAPAPVLGIKAFPHHALPFFAHEEPRHHQPLHPTFVFPNDVNIPSIKGENKESKINNSSTVIEVVVLTAGVFAFIVMVFFGLMAFRERGKKKKKERAVRTILFPGFCGGGTQEAEVPNSSSFANKEGFDEGPEHFYLNILGPSAKATSELKHHSGSLNVPTKTKAQSSPGRGRINRSDHRILFSLDRKEMHFRSKSAGEETFRAISGSQHSGGRVSDVSDAISGPRSLASSPWVLPKQYTLRGAAFLSPRRTASFSSTPNDRSASPISSDLQNEAATLQSSDAVLDPVHFAKAAPPPPPPPLPVRLPPRPVLPKGLPQPPSKCTAFQPKKCASECKEGNDLPKLKPLHWDKVRAASDRSMVWDKLRAGSFEFDEEMIESLFGYNLQNQGRNDEVRLKGSPPKIHVFDQKRLQNITILSKALNSSPEQVCDALMQGGGLAIEQLEALARMVPTRSEEEKLLKYDGDITELGLGERYVKEMLNLPLAFLRVEAMLYKETFDDEVLYLKKSFVTLEDACKELKSSRLFLKLLEAVLKTGNRMNDGTSRGGAKAFKLDALLKLADVKSSDGKTTLLHFVVQEMIRFEGAQAYEETEASEDESRHELSLEREERYRRTGLNIVSRLSTELSDVKRTASMDLDALENSVSKLSEGSMKLKELLQEGDLLMDSKSRKFVKSMKSFLYHAEDEIQKLKQDEERVLHMVGRITEYFHGNRSKDEANPLRIFVIVSSFLGMLDQVCKEIRKSKPSGSPQVSMPSNFSASVDREH